MLCRYREPVNSGVRKKLHAASRTMGDEDGRAIGSVLEVKKQIPV